MIEETAYAPVVSPVSSIDPHALGKRGERRACDNLRERGWDILQTNWDSGFGEVDIIARAPELPYETVVFVEVKTRRTLGADDLMPEEAVDFDVFRAVCCAVCICKYGANVTVIAERRCRKDRGKKGKDGRKKRISG